DASPLSFGEIVYYDGSEKHSSMWIRVIQEELAKKGWFLRIGKPDRIGAALLACRDHNPASWLSRRWKSNVKAANAIAYRLILIAQPENGYIETMPEEIPLWFESVAHLKDVIGTITHRDS